MDIVLVIILGIVQGLTEFLPVSSSGHLVLLENIFGIGNASLFFNIVLHCATLLAVLIYYRKKIYQMIRHPLQAINLYLILSTAITCVIVVLFADFFENSFNGALLAWGFLLSAIFLYITELISKSYDKQRYTYQNIGLKQSILLGLFQGCAILPGISRSGTTLCAGIVLGINKKDALDYSFLMSIPIIIASLVFELCRADFNTITAQFSAFEMLVGGLTAFVCALLGIKIMLKVVEKVKYKYFALYLAILSIAVFFLL